MKSSLQAEAIIRAAKKDIPLPLEELYLLWQPVTNHEHEQDFFVAGVARNLIDAMSQTLTAASIKPYIMDLKPLALARVANRDNTIIASLEADCFDIVLVVKGLPVILHTANPRWEGATPEENARQLVSELLKTVSFYNDSHPESPIAQDTPLLLTGELSSNAAIARLIQDDSGYNVEPLVPLLKYPSDLNVSTYAANIGLALKKETLKPAAQGATSRFRDININVLSGKYRKTAPRPVSKKSIMGWLFVTAAIILLLPLYYLQNQVQSEATRRQTELSRAEQELYQAEQAAVQAAQLETTIRDMTAETSALEQERNTILAPKGDFTDDLRMITDVLPPQTYFTDIEISEKRITVRGETATTSRIISYATALEAQNRFPEVRITEIDERSSLNPGETGMVTPEKDSYMVTFTIAISKYTALTR